MKKLATTVFVGLVLAAGCTEEVKMVEVDPPSIDFKKVTQSEKVEAKALGMRSEVVPGITFTFSSENSSVATVTSDGTVKPVGDGSTAIVAKTLEGVTGECFVKVCLPNELICDPADELKLKVGTTGPIKCAVSDCKGEKIPADIKFEVKSETIARSYEEANVFVGLEVGDTTVVAKSYGLEASVKIHVDEQIYLPGMEPGAGGGGGGGGKGKGGEKDPYNEKGGRFDHILDNMKF